MNGLFSVVRCQFRLGINGGGGGNSLLSLFVLKYSDTKQRCALKTPRDGPTRLPGVNRTRVKWVGEEGGNENKKLNKKKNP